MSVDSAFLKADSNKEDEQYYESIRDECIKLIHTDANSQYSKSLNMLIELIHFNEQETLDFILDYQLLNLILERIDLSYPSDVINSLNIIKNMVEIERYRDSIYQSDLVQNILQLIHNTLDIDILADILDIIAKLIKNSEEFFIHLIESEYINEFCSQIMTIAGKLSSQHDYSKFSKYLFKFLSSCYFFGDISIPEPLFNDIPDFIFSSLLNSSFEEINFKLQPLIMIINNFHDTFILNFTEVDKLSVLIDILLNTLNNEFDHYLNSKIAKRICLLLDSMFVSESSISLQLTKEDLINIHFFEALSQTFNAFPEVATVILSIIGKLVLLELIVDPEIPLELISRANTELSLHEKNSYAFLFYSCSRVLYNSFCQFVYENFDMIDGLLDILYGQDPSNIYSIMEGLVNIIEFAKAYSFDINLIIEKLTEHAITKEFIQETMDLFSGDINIYECCIRFLSVFETEDTENINHEEDLDEYD
ncbi:hypothetical protein TVAG_154240 [Trichomonas vaginalis G3]|uniref:Uncharacterized protein n=1 Tax=Trichomonas vaginalis (strain ATCC PRA-98 / G3) TaxID=412133 RepID=A2E430_TRIV3|nr:armadillo (ARM) repeat-containing protein family [Trichomonas vaginalis G3]EAY12573.1 hypothetical protein TVAG_154240 [Trichomonas vaginalis G3]KAI5509410.1 armadillo (ARM) repeat-containing protein family [Trichomonas vaginalis G3]|eukprot:XP_001324796.1 hypothetical protein [Trichomonas vaginalis G3]